MSGRETGRRDGEPAFILHHYPYKETSLVLEAFSRHHGRVAIVARGARRPASALRGVLRAFQLVELSWFGKGELRTLHGAQPAGGFMLLHGQALMCGFYLNELILKLLPRDDPHERLFDAYEATLKDLAAGADEAAPLRRFELRLLREMGYGPQLEREVETGSPITAGERYQYVVERGPVHLAASESGESRIELRGKTLLDMAAEDYSDTVTLQQSKALMRLLLNHYLGGRTLYSRQLLRDLQQL